MEVIEGFSLTEDVMALTLNIEFMWVLKEVICRR